MADEIRTPPTEELKDGLAAAVATALYDDLSQERGEYYLKIGEDETTMQFRDGPGAAGLRPSEFRVSIWDSNEGAPGVGPDGVEQWEDVLVVAVRYERRRRPTD